MTSYDPVFYELEGKVARESAEVVIPWLVDEYPDLDTVIDVGAGTGEWAYLCRVYGLKAWTVDHLVPDDMIISPAFHLDMDLNETQAWPKTDLAICVEVAEHLAPQTGPQLVEALARAGLVLFSAATPGQPGVGHINCRPHEYWHGLFADHCMTPTFLGDRFTEPVADFYRRNLFVYS